MSSRGISLGRARRTSFATVESKRERERERERERARAWHPPFDRSERASTSPFEPFRYTNLFPTTPASLLLDCVGDSE